ncbi:MAG: PAS domain S-box protein [Candidatus Odinarchaeota archaeon]
MSGNHRIPIARRAAGSVADRVSRNPVTVLHVDDDEQFLALTKHYLEKIGRGSLVVDSVADPERVSVESRKKPYDVIVSDYEMPGVNGLQLLERLKKRGCTIPFVMLTGRGREEVAMQALNLGADRYIMKGRDSESLFGELFHAVNMIVRRYRMERALREREMEFRTVFDEALSPVLVVDEHGRYTDANAAALDFLETDRETLLGKTVWDFTPPDLLEKQKREHAPFIGPRTLETEYLVNGKVKTLLLNVVPLTLPGKTVLYGIGMDITKRKKTEEAVSIERERLLSVLEELPGFVYLQAADRSVVFLNRYTREHFGALADDPCYRVFFGRDNPCPSCPTLQVLRTGQPQHREATTRTEQHYYIYYYPFTDVDGTPLVLKLGLDITERKKTENRLIESEQRFKNAFDYAAIGRAMGRPAGPILQANAAFCGMLGYSKTELLQKSWVDIIHPDFLAPSHEQVKQLLEGLIPALQLELQLVHGKGNLLWGHLNAVLVRDPNGNPLYLVADLIDITDRKLAEERLQESERRFAAFAEHLPGAVFMKDSMGRFLYFNRTAEKAVGMELKDWQGKTAREVFPAEVARQLEMNDSLVLTERKSIETIEGIPQEDGMHHWLTAKFPLTSTDDQSDILAGVAIDITAHENAKTALAESEKKYRTIIERLPLALHMYRLEPGGKLVFTGANPAADRIFCIDNNQFTGRIIEEAFPSLAGTEIPDRYRRVATTGTDWKAEQVFYRDDRIIGTLKIHAFQVSSGNMIATFQEVADHGQKEKPELLPGHNRA